MSYWKGYPILQFDIGDRWLLWPVKIYIYKILEDWIPFSTAHSLMTSSFHQSIFSKNNYHLTEPTVDRSRYATGQILFLSNTDSSKYFFQYIYSLSKSLPGDGQALWWNKRQISEVIFTIFQVIYGKRLVRMNCSLTHTLQVYKRTFHRYIDWETTQKLQEIKLWGKYRGKTICHK